MIVLDWTYRLTRWALGTVFIYAGIPKLLEPKSFVVLIEAYGLVPDLLLVPMAISLALLEVAGGVGLLFDVRGSLSVIAGLLVLFVAILAYGLGMGLDIDCGCFGSDDPEAEAFHDLSASLYRDLLMLAMVIFMFGWRRIRRIKPVNLSQLNIKKRILNRKEDMYD
jgi:uncharacterized membrane protein YphA (DoxX/SURF4 family)